MLCFWIIFYWTWRKWRKLSVFCSFSIKRWKIPLNWRWDSRYSLVSCQWPSLASSPWCPCQWRPRSTAARPISNMIALIMSAPPRDPIMAAARKDPRTRWTWTVAFGRSELVRMLLQKFSKIQPDLNEFTG